MLTLPRQLRTNLGYRAAGVLALVAIVGYMLPRIAQNGFAYLLQTLIIGLATGAIYALIAIGYTMVYGIIELINFAHGDIFTLAAFISLPLLAFTGLTENRTGTAGVVLPLITVFLIVMFITGIIAMGIERLAYRPLRGAPRLAPLITAVGMSFILEGLMFIWKGPYNLHYPDLLPATRIPLGTQASIGVKDIFTIGVALVLVLVLTLFVNRSRMGRAMRATAQDHDAAQLMGIDINRTISLTFFIGAALAGAGGMVYGLYINSVEFQLGFQIGLVAFTAAVFGGIGNIPGAALGGLAIGVIRALSDGYLKTTWTDVITFGVLILVLVFKPTGLLGMRVPEK